VFINRCGVLAGAGQFGRADQGIFAYWLNSYLRRRPLKYIGFGGHGHQVRDCLALPVTDRIVNCSGGAASARSLRQLSDWCAERFGPHTVTADTTPRPFDIPWIVLDSTKAARVWDWQPQTTTEQILEEIAAHARLHPDWLDLSAPF
ncbi:MAG: CDP-tyvelose epimerase, partial [Opitutaceae bacterium]|nr:CDP-tyvelose epimerase [Opitutaceae bacterium]